MPASAFWALSSEQARAEAAGTARGLSPEEAAARLRRWGPNELAPPRPLEALREIVRFRVNPLVLILPVAAALLRIPARPGGGLPGAGGDREALVLPALSDVIPASIGGTR